MDSPPNWTKEEIDAVVSEAHAHGVKVAAHARSDSGLRIAIAAGVDSIEHGDSIRPGGRGRDGAEGNRPLPHAHRRRTTSRVLGRRQGAPCARSCPRSTGALSRTAGKAGVKIVFGTDAGGFPWTEINQAQEFEYEVALGMSPIEAIRSATTTAAELLGMTGQIGIVERGAFADLVAVCGRPAEGRRRSREDRLRVMKGGEVVRPLPAR